MHTSDLLQRRYSTLGTRSPLFYREPVHIVSGEGVRLTAAEGTRYLDCYNNVPHVGHANPRVTEAARDQLSLLNVHTRYLNDRVVEYSEQLLATFDGALDRVSYGNSGSEANELALRISRLLSGNSGVIVSDFSYHGTTITLAGMTTGITVGEPLSENVRAIRIPDLDSDPRSEELALSDTLAAVDEAIASLQEQGHGVSAGLFDAFFSNEGLPRVPRGLLAGIAERIRAAGGFMIADEVQSGFGRGGSRMWGHQHVGLEPDLVTLGKPMGNGHPVSAVVTRAEILEAFGERNAYFNTFAGNPVSAAIAEAVLRETQERDLIGRAAEVSRLAVAALQDLSHSHEIVAGVKGTGMFLGLEIERGGAPAPESALEVVEAVKRRGVLISRTGRHGNVLKIRPPFVFGREDLPQLLDALEASLSEVESADR